MAVEVDLSGVGSGFAAPVFQSQETYRLILQAMAFPGRIVTGTYHLERGIGLDQASAAVCLTLLDGETPLWLQEGCEDRLASWLRFQCGCPLVEDPAAAAFALISDPLAMPPMDTFSSGTAQYPDRSTTLILQMDTLEEGNLVVIRGPGIKERMGLTLASLPEAFWEQRQQVCDGFPQGIDLILTCGRRLAALPRTTRIERTLPCTSR